MFLQDTRVYQRQGLPVNKYSNKLGFFEHLSILKKQCLFCLNYNLPANIFRIFSYIAAINVHLFFFYFFFFHWWQNNENRLPKLFPSQWEILYASTIIHVPCDSVFVWSSRHSITDDVTAIFFISFLCWCFAGCLMWFKSCSNSDTMSWTERRRRNRPYGTLIKKKTKFSSYIRKFRWDRCKVIYEEWLPNIWGGL